MGYNETETWSHGDRRSRKEPSYAEAARSLRARKVLFIPPTIDARHGNWAGRSYNLTSSLSHEPWNVSVCTGFKAHLKKKHVSFWHRPSFFLASRWVFVGMSVKSRQRLQNAFKNEDSNPVYDDKPLRLIESSQSSRFRDSSWSTNNFFLVLFTLLIVLCRSEMKL